MLSFWARYVVLKENQGQIKEITLQTIESVFGAVKRQEIEQELVSG